MKAAVINGFGEIPQYKEFPDPVPANGDIIIDVKAIAIENLDKLVVSGKHYSSKRLFLQSPAIPRIDGVGTTPDGKLVAYGNVKSPYGAFAEKVIAGYTFLVPDGIAPEKASAILPSVLTSLLPLKYSAELQPGETVLVNGATGVSGRIAVQVAKMLGAGKIIGTGRNERSLELLTQLGADQVISLEESEDNLSKSFVEAGGDHGCDVVMDFLWGHPAEILIHSLIPVEVGFAQRRIRYLPIGEMAGSVIPMSASAFRTSGLEMMGVGQISREKPVSEINKVWNGIKNDEFYMEIEKAPLANIAEAWQRKYLAGKRLVIVP